MEKLLLNISSNELINLSCPIGHLHAYSKKSPYREDENEDSAMILYFDGHLILAAADGAGGHPAGQKASRRSIESLHQCLQKVSEGTKVQTHDIRNAIIDGFELANETLLKEGTGLATTLVVAHVNQEHCRTYHTGDSEALLISGAGNIKHVTPPHSPVGHAVESGYLTQLESLTHPERHIVSHFLGRTDFKIEVGPMNILNTRDTLVVCTDGLTDNFSHLELKEYFKNLNSEESCQFLITELNKRMNEEGQEIGKPDDCTFIIFNTELVK